MKTCVFLEKLNDEKENMPKNIAEIHSRMVSLFKTEPDVEREIQIQLSSIVSQLYHAALNSTDGYCYKFNLPIVSVQSIFKKIKISPTIVEEVFRKDWAYPKNAHMYSD